MTSSGNRTIAASHVECPVPGRFEGLKVLVTGAGSGIGLATALRVALEGGHVIAIDLDPSRLQALVSGHPDLDFTTVAGDITDDDHIAAVVSACDGRLDGLVNNAGINDGFVPLDEVSDALWERTLAINLTAPFKITRALIPLLLGSPQAAIVNVGSVAALRGSASGTAYTTSKHALVGLTRSTSFLYENIRCNMVAPGGVATNIDGKPRSEKGAKRILEAVAVLSSKVARPEQIASLITFLLSRDASNIDGAVLPCDGGMGAV